MRRKTRSAAQRAATKRLVAFNKARRTRSANPIARKRHHAKRRRRHNPISAGHVATIRRTARRLSRKVHHVMRRRRHNPIRMGGMVGGIVHSLVMPAATATAGALVLDLAWAHLPIPATWKAGNLQYAAKAAGAVGLALLARKVVKRQTADAMGVGALTVIMHDAAKSILAKVVPGMNLGFYNPAFPVGIMNNVGEYMGDTGEYVGGMGQYVGGYDADNAWANYYGAQR